MTTAHATPAAHDVHHHEHHVSSMKVLVGVFVALLILTVLTVYTAKYVDLGYYGNFALAMFIASFKASLVCAFFMHLLHDNKFNSVVLLYCILTLALFLLFTKIDLDSRAVVDPLREGNIEPPAMAEEARQRFFEEHGYYPGEHAAEGHGEGASAGSDDH